MANKTFFSVNAEGPITLQSAATTGNGNSIISNGATANLAISIDWSAGCSAGAVTIEHASHAAYAGTWSSLAVVAWSAAGRQDVVQILGITGVIRARISTTIVGGTVSVYAFGSK